MQLLPNWIAEVFVSSKISRRHFLHQLLLSYTMKRKSSRTSSENLQPHSTDGEGRREKDLHHLGRVQGRLNKKERFKRRKESRRGWLSVGLEKATTLPPMRKKDVLKRWRRTGERRREKHLSSKSVHTRFYLWRDLYRHLAPTNDVFSLSHPPTNTKHPTERERERYARTCLRWISLADHTYLGGTHSRETPLTPHHPSFNHPLFFLHILLYLSIYVYLSTHLSVYVYLPINPLSGLCLVVKDNLRAATSLAGGSLVWRRRYRISGENVYDEVACYTKKREKERDIDRRRNTEHSLSLPSQKKKTQRETRRDRRERPRDSAWSDRVKNTKISFPIRRRRKSWGERKNIHPCEGISWNSLASGESSMPR